MGGVARSEGRWKCPVLVVVVLVLERIAASLTRKGIRGSVAIKRLSEATKCTVKPAISPDGRNNGTVCGPEGPRQLPAKAGTPARRALARRHSTKPTTKRPAPLPKIIRAIRAIRSFFQQQPIRIIRAIRGYSLLSPHHMIFRQSLRQSSRQR